MPSTSLADDLRAETARGGVPAAIALVEARASGNDPDALQMLGQWRLWGIYGPRDLRAGYAAIAAAAMSGSEAALMTQAALLCTGTGTDPDQDAAIALVRGLAVSSEIARRQIALVDAAPTQGAWRILRTSPYAAHVEALLSEAECTYVIDRIGANVRPSLVVDPRTGRRVPNPVRDSHGTNVPPVEEDIVLHAINRRIADATETMWSQGEPLHLLRYAPGQQYRSHLDALPGVSNQRTTTVLIYLNDDYVGGETRFKDGLSFRGGTGDALVFSNLREDGSADRRTEHAGLPVGRGVKWLATRWIRQKPFDPWNP